MTPDNKTLSTNPNTKTKGTYSLSLVVPAYNEEENLENTLDQTKNALDQLGIAYEFIIVNDCSQDDTKTMAENIASHVSSVRCYHHDINKGIGGAFWTGVQHATKDYVLLLPADNPLGQEELASYLKHMGTFDIVAGVRQERVGYNRLSNFLSYVYNRILIPGLFHLSLKDVNWIHAYRRDIFQQGGIKIEHPGIFFFVEVLVKAKRKNFTIAQIPADMKKRVHGRTTISRFPVILKTFWDTVTFFVKIHTTKN